MREAGGGNSRQCSYTALGRVVCRLDGALAPTSSDDGSSREEVVIDPKTGAYIGSREVATSGRNRGQVLSYSSFTTATAPAPWQAPR